MNERSRFFADSANLVIGRDPDDLVGRTARSCEVVPDGTVSGPEAARHGFAHNGDRWRIRGIRGREVTALDDLGADCLKIAAADPRGID